MIDTFAKLGIPFPLFEASVESATEYTPLAYCFSCRQVRPHGFYVHIGDYVMLNCPNCGEMNGLHACERKNVPCRACKTIILFPSPHPRTPVDANGEIPLLICYECLQQGKAALGKDTEFGAIWWEQAVRGVTHGVPGLNRPGYEMIETAPAEGEWEAWYGVRLPTEWMWELLRTPSYHTWQGEQWLFCCQRPMIYVGEWTREDFNGHAPDKNGAVFFRKVIPDAIPGLWESLGHGSPVVYVFHCPVCQCFQGHWDMD